MTDLDQRLAALSPEKRALFERRLRQRGLAEHAENVFPLSVAQQGVWFLEQLRPHNPAYVVSAAVRISGRLNVAALLDAVNEIVRRHESLRSTFQLRDGKPMQIVQGQMTLDLPEIVLAERLDDDELADRIVEALAEPFDLATGPLLRLRLLRLGEQEYVLALAMHHLISDGWSTGVLLGELSAVYAARIGGRPSPLPDLPIQYGDFATWQQRWLREEDLSADLAYWRRHLAGAPAALALPTDRPRPAMQGFRGASHPFALSAAAFGELAAMAKRHGATTYMALLAAFHVLLHRWSNQDDVVVGVPMAGRERTETEPLIGFFVNTLPVRADLGGDPAFAEVLNRVRDACLGAYAHQRVPFERVVEELKPARDLSRPPIFQVALSYQSDPLPTLDLAGVEFERIALPAQGARFDLELQFFNDAGGLSGWFEYDRDLFDEATIARMAGHLHRIIEHVVRHPQTPVGELPLLTETEHREVLATATGPTRRWPEAGWIHQCFEEQARRTPDAEAVRFEGERLSYAELNAWANRLARRLRAAGVGRDVVVGVCLPRSLELVAGLLAVVKAGGAYLPLDPGYPAERLEFMLTDARPRVLLTRRHLLAGLPRVEAEVWCVEELAGELAAWSGDDLDVPVDGEDAVYVIYTSGSTGTPKGVVNVHAGIRNRLLWMQDEYGLDGTDRVLQKTPFSFDVSVWEFFWPLMTGAVLVVARPDGHKDPHYLVQTIRAEQITTVHFVPSMLQVFLREPEVVECTTLRRVICSGEALSREAQERFFACSKAELHNLYGPTEAAVDVTYWTCRDDDDPRPVPIGFPIANTRVHVLDRFGRPVPIGVAGEIYIGGRNVARGYLGRPELTGRRFVPDPFAAGAATAAGDVAGPDGGVRPAARLYRTGDLGRVRADGAIEYLGRLDHQVKLRGFRIELGEIESVLVEHPAVREAVVLAREHGGDVRLVGYVTGEPTPAGELSGFLRRRLPDYMVPAAFVHLPAIPLTPNGKVDRDALPQPGTDRPELAGPYVAPRDDTERAVAAIWRELLGVARVGVEDNFFELGGHSLLMPEVRLRIAATLGREVTLVELFQYPTVGSLAGHLDRPATTDTELMAGARDRAGIRRRSMSGRREAANRRMRARNGR